MERYPESTLIGGSAGPPIIRDPDHPGYLGPILIPLGQVVLFARPDCELCERVRAILRARGLAWREVNAADSSFRLRCEQLIFTSYLRVPTLCACGYSVVGFDEPRLHEVLTAHIERLERLSASGDRQ